MPKPKWIWVFCAIVFLGLAGMNLYAFFFELGPLQPIIPYPEVQPVEGMPAMANEWVSVVADNQKQLIKSYNNTVNTSGAQIAQFNKAWRMANLISGLGFLGAFATCVLGYRKV